MHHLPGVVVVRAAGPYGRDVDRAPRRWTAPARRVDVLLAAAAVAVGVVEALAVTTGPERVLRAVLTGAMAAGLLWRRSQPLLCAGVVSVLLVAVSLLRSPNDTVVVIAVLVLASYGVATHAGGRDAVVGCVLLAVAVTAALVADPTEGDGAVVPGLLLFVGVPALLGTSVRRRQQSASEREREARELAVAAAAAVDAERARIARELHDVVSHAVTLVAVQAEAGQAVIDTDVEAARRSLAAIGTASREALGELARLLAVLHDEPQTGEPGLANLPALVEGARAAGLVVAVRSQPDPVPLPPALDLCAYRVVQEGITNALRHVADASVEVDVSTSDDALEVAVRSHGRRHRSSHGTGHGLSGLGERVRGLGGELEASDLDGGFALTARLPLPAARPAPA